MRRARRWVRLLLKAFGGVVVFGIVAVGVGYLQGRTAMGRAPDADRLWPVAPPVDGVRACFVGRAADVGTSRASGSCRLVAILSLSEFAACHSERVS